MTSWDLGNIWTILKKRKTCFPWGMHTGSAWSSCRMFRILLGQKDRYGLSSPHLLCEHCCDMDQPEPTVVLSVPMLTGRVQRSLVPSPRLCSL